MLGDHSDNCCYLVDKLCPTLCDPMDCSPPGCSVHGILQARILEWVAVPFSRGSSQSRDWTHVSCGSCIGRATREVPLWWLGYFIWKQWRDFEDIIKVPSGGERSSPAEHDEMNSPVVSWLWRGAVSRAWRCPGCQPYHPEELNPITWMSRKEDSELQRLMQPGWHLDFNFVRLWASHPALLCLDFWPPETEIIHVCSLRSVPGLWQFVMQQLTVN